MLQGKLIFSSQFNLLFNLISFNILEKINTYIRMYICMYVFLFFFIIFGHHKCDEARKHVHKTVKRLAQLECMCVYVCVSTKVIEKHLHNFRSV